MTSTLASQPAQLPGLHNLFELKPGLLSGSGPQGEVGFATLQQLGVRTVLSVDGSRPDIEHATKAGLRYVHIPVGYDGIPLDKQAAIARAVRDLPHPIYIHCHHGKHRGPAAAASAAVSLGRMTPEEGVAFLKRAGTADMYTGLYACVREGRRLDEASLSRAPADFPPVASVGSFIETMVRIDECFEHLQLIQKANWTVPADHPDLSPQSESRQLVAHFQRLEQDAQNRPNPERFREFLGTSIAESARLSSLVSHEGDLDRAACDQQVTAIQASCKGCHAAYRDHR